jgi:ketosteroid isomerase-like protein
MLRFLLIGFMVFSAFTMLGGGIHADTALISVVGPNHTGTSAYPETKENHVHDQNTIRGLMDHWLKAYNRKDIDNLKRLYSDRIYYANNGNSLALDKDAITRNYAQQFVASPKTRIEFAEELVSVTQDMGYIAGKYKVIVPQENKEAAHFFGRVLLIFERSSNHEKGVDGWELVVDFDNQGSDITIQDF